MDWSQDIYLALLLIGSGAALSVGGRKGLVFVMWANFLATMTLAGTPMGVGVADIACTCVLMFTGGKRAYALALLFAVMIPLYTFTPILGNYATYSIVDALAYCQIVILGGGGFGNLVRNLAFYTTIRPVRVSNSVDIIRAGRRTSAHSGNDAEGFAGEGMTK